MDIHTDHIEQSRGEGYDARAGRRERAALGCGGALNGVRMDHITEHGTLLC